MATISVITATFNCAALIPGLIESLRAQSDLDFEWVVADAGSSDDTLAIIRAASDLAPKIILGPDFGIYDALNKAIKAAIHDYYVVVGADDKLAHDAIRQYRGVIFETGAGIIGAGMLFGSREVHAGAGWSWLRGGNAFIAGHSVGCLIKRELHSEFGYYSNRFVNAADMHFVRKVIATRPSELVTRKFIAGRFGDTGVSSTDVIASLSDFFRIQLLFERNKLVQFLIHLVRLTRHAPAIVAKA